MKIILTDKLLNTLQEFESIFFMPGDIIILEENWHCDLLVENIIIAVNEKTLFAWIIKYTKHIEAFDLLKILLKFQIDEEPLALKGWRYDNKTFTPIFNQIKKDALECMSETKKAHLAMGKLNNIKRDYLNNECPFNSHQLLMKDGELKAIAGKSNLETKM